MSKTLPPLPDHPEPRVMAWSEMEKRTITEYGKACYAAGLEAQGVPDVDALAQFIREIDGAHRFGAGALAEHICGWLASAPPAPQANVIDYKPGTWFDATSVDLMQRFFESRLPAIREVAREHGYAIGVHGSMRRDMDLIAAPWREGASTADELAHAIANAACGITRDGLYQWENKPAGRVATSIPICWTHRHGVVSDGHIDLSVMPQVSAMANGLSREVFEDWIRADSTLPLDRDSHGYSDMTTALMWHAWQAAVFASAPPAKPIGWLYDWTHSSATGKPDEVFTGFTTSEEYARKHDNARQIFEVVSAKK